MYISSIMNNKVSMWNGDTSTTHTNFKIALFTTTVTGISQTVNYPAGITVNTVITTPIAWVVRDITSVAQFTMVQVESATTTNCVISVAESKNTGVLIGGTVEGLETSTGVTVCILLFYL